MPKSTRPAAPAPLPPRATVRLQLHRDFPFAAAAAQVPYLAALGISHVYASPILKARAGSTHGYDVVDPGCVNPELGGEDGLRALVATLRAHGMGLVVDIVPNHMAVGGPENPYWLDVLEWGRASPYAEFFDIDWDATDPALRGRLLAPFLGAPYGEALDRGELRLHFDAVSGRFSCAYFDNRFPIAPTRYPALLRLGGEALAAAARDFRAALAGRAGGRRERFDAACRRFAQEAAGGGPLAEALAGLYARFAPDSAEGRQRLHYLLERQPYRLAFWRTAADEINWRRFFDVSELAGVRVELPAVFERVHATTLRLYAEGLIDGVRVDHVDGLADPRAYCRRLRRALAQAAKQRPADAPAGRAWLVVEKILAATEHLPADWQTDGTTGYSFMNSVGALLHDPAGEAPLARLWSEVTGRSAQFEDEERAARRRIPKELLGADFNACAHALHTIARSDPRTRDCTLLAIRRVLAELLVQFPVYRTYADARGRNAGDAALMQGVIAATAAQCRPADRWVLEHVDRWLGGEPPEAAPGITGRRLRLRAIGRFQQLSAPTAAKSVEDTAFYRHGKLLSRNEVGANPAQFALSPAEFHAEARARRRHFPDALLATATHDHKRGEDLRARLAVLSELPEAWRQQLERWRLQNAPLRPAAGPDAADECMLYQMLVGIWPAGATPPDAATLAVLRERLGGWQLKALREAKRHSHWSEPNLEYEAACADFLAALLDPARAADFLAGLHGFAARIAPAGAVNSLLQTLLRLGTPGVPDLYQGCEFWDQSLVDPDNRRPVDWPARAAALAGAATDAELLAAWPDGRLKQRLIARMLELRRADPALFARGDWRELAVLGRWSAQVFAAVRVREGRCVLLAGLRLATGLLIGGEQSLVPPTAVWGDTRLKLPGRLAGLRWRSVLDAGLPPLTGATIPAGALFARWPVAVLAGGG
ncbi:MAG: malto-oligosyltrehalose synthase [Proteobacteria bacterium]|nr:malto-oligosyltrehalose synthase [Pseudomonadota bacterium]